MKNFLLNLSITIFIFSQVLLAQWIQINPAQPRAVRSMYFFDNKYGFMVLYDETLKTTDGGNSWRVSLTSPASDNKKLVFYNTRTAFLVSGHSLARTYNAGGSWDVFRYDGNLYYDLVLFDAHKAITFGNKIFMTYDFGNNWTEINTGLATMELRNADFSDSLNGIAVGNKGVILKSTDGGLNWAIKTSGTTKNLTRIHFIDSSTVVATGFGGIILRSTNAGESWINVSPMSNRDFYDMSFSNDTTGYVAGSYNNLNGTILKTTNKGLTWKVLYATPTQKIETFSCINDTTFYYTTSNPYVYRTNDAGKNWFKQINIDNTLNYITFATDSIGIAVGNVGTIIRTSNRGVNWHSVPSRTMNKIYNAAFVDSKYGFAVCDSGILLKSTDAGQFWTSKQIHSEQLTSVDFIDSLTGLVTTVTGAILKTTDGGENWIIKGSFNQIIYSVAYASKLVATTVGAWGKINRTTDGGETWTNQPTGLLYTHFKKISYIDSLNGYILSQNNNPRLLKTTDGGLNWVRLYSNNNIVSADFSLLSLDTFYIALQSSQYLRTLNGFQNYDSAYYRNDLYRTEFRSIYFLTPDKGFAVGDNGIIITSNNALPVELTTITCNIVGGKVELNWITKTETNNNGFEIESKFEDNNWITKGFVKGAGTSSEPKQYKFIDNLNKMGKYSYRLKQIDFNGNYEYSEIVETFFAQDFALGQNYPNPFNPSTTINFSLPIKSKVVIKVFDVLGNEVSTLINEEKDSGSYEVKWDTFGLSSGTYFYQLQAGEFISTKKMVLLK